MYTATINQNGMILLNKHAREALGVKIGDKVTINFSKKSATVTRAMTDEEFFDKLDAMKSANTREKIAANAGKSADELFGMAIKKATLEEES